MERGETGPPGRSSLLTGGLRLFRPATAPAASRPDPSPARFRRGMLGSLWFRFGMCWCFEFVFALVDLVVHRTAGEDDGRVPLQGPSVSALLLRILNVFMED